MQRLGLLNELCKDAPSQDLHWAVSQKSRSWGRQKERRGSRGGTGGRLYRSGRGQDGFWVGGSGGGGGQSLEPERRQEDGQLHSVLDLLFPELNELAARPTCGSHQLSQDPVATATSQMGTGGQSRSPAGKRCFFSLAGIGDIKKDQNKPFEVRLSSCLPVKRKGCKSPRVTVML